MLDAHPDEEAAMVPDGVHAHEAEAEAEAEAPALPREDSD